MKSVLVSAVFLCLAFAHSAFGESAQDDKYEWDGVARIVAVGDLHGDYDHYIETLEIAGLVNRRGRWIGGETHLVQTGDIPDRGPDTREIMDHIDKLARQAEKDGGQVHLLIGNHEAMNVYGDLRYVTEAEYKAFANVRSGALVDRYFEMIMEEMQNSDAEAFNALPEDYREQWDALHPPGFIEHRRAWDPQWDPEGEYAVRARTLKTAVKINGTVFVHGGISDRYADMSLAEMTRKVQEILADFDFENPGLVADECGPLWYRGLAGTAPEVSPEVLASILERLSAQRIVVGHTPTPGVIWPRYDGRVVQIDTGIANHYGGHPAYLEINEEGAFAGYSGGRLALPETDEGRLAYLDEVIALEPENNGLSQFRTKLTAPASAAEESPGEGDEKEETPPEDEANTCLKDASVAAL